MRHSFDRGSERRVAPPPSPRELTNVVRRMGWVLQKLHETAMSALIAAQKEALAEEFNDIVKPVVDYMLNARFTPEAEDAPIRP